MSGAGEVRSPALSIFQDRIVSMSEFIVPITAPQAMDAGRFGPKAANLALLGNAGLPIPEGYCLGADGYRRQLEFLGLHESARGVFSAEDSAKARLRARHETGAHGPADLSGNPRAVAGRAP